MKKILDFSIIGCFCASTLILLFQLSLMSFQHQEAGVVYFDPSVVELGTFEYGKEQQVPFELRLVNTTNDVVHVERFETSCGCLGVSSPVMEVGPNSSIRAAGKMTISGKVSPVVASVSALYSKKGGVVEATGVVLTGMVNSVVDPKITPSLMPNNSKDQNRRLDERQRADVPVDGTPANAVPVKGRG